MSNAEKQARYRTRLAERQAARDELIKKLQWQVHALSYRLAQRDIEEGKAEWIEGSIAKAQILCAIRDRFSNDQEFDCWADENFPNLAKDERNALLGLGCLDEDELYDILNQFDTVTLPEKD